MPLPILNEKNAQTGLLRDLIFSSNWGLQGFYHTVKLYTYRYSSPNSSCQLIVVKNNNQDIVNKDKVS
jgi:hypothetical protein